MMSPTLHSLIILFFTVNSIENAEGEVDKITNDILRSWYDLEPEVTMSWPEMVKNAGYPAEIHEVETEDGYILTVHSIPRGRNGQPADPKKLPIMLIHCTYCSSDIWVSNVPEKSLGYLLADAGFDVWMFNYRGNEYSRKHKTLNIHQAAYWDFSADEISYYDMAASIDFIIKKTGKSKVNLLGHSIGGCLPFTLLADRPEYNKKVQEIYALSPLGNFAGVRGLLSYGAKILPPLLEEMQRNGIYDLIYPQYLSKAFLGYYVKFNDATFKNFMASLVGPFPNNWNATRSPIFAAHIQGGVAINVLLHFAQLANNPGLRHFDMGLKKNMVKYNQSTTPDYDLKKVTVPVNLYYANNDYIASKPNVEFLQNNSPNVKSFHEIGHDSNHLSPIWGTDADVFLNQLVATIASAQP